MLIDKLKDIFRRDQGHWSDLSISSSIKKDGELGITIYIPS